MPTVYDEFCIVQDNDCHGYVIPEWKRQDWYIWLEIPENDERAWEVPSYATRIDGGHVIFTEWRIG